MKHALTQSKEDAIKVAQQTLSDQEVIAFLDERVHELETSLDKTKKEMSGVEESLNKGIVTTEKQVVVLRDLLSFERDQGVEKDRDYKATKKVLVKEVKHCRAEIMALEAERDGLREENRMLK